MFDLGWTELLLIGIVALIVVGPKDLPLLFRKVGNFVGKARSMAREFSRAMDDAADETGVKEVAKSLKAASNPLQAGLDRVKSAATDFTKYSPESETGKLAVERAVAGEKIREASAKKATKRKGFEKAAVSKTAAKKTTAPRATAPKTTLNEPSAKKPVDKSKQQPTKATANTSEASKD
jgi:sec-independent protein translocase protein TatB